MHSVIDRTEKTQNDRVQAQIADTIAENLRKSLFSEGYVRTVSVDTLGHGARIHLLICLDKQETWPGKILQNSRYARFSWDVESGKLEMYSGGYKCAKFRKCTVKENSASVISQKITEWIAKSNNP